MVKNPLIPDILSLLQQHPEGITEYLIIKSLEKHIGFKDIDDDEQLAIFQKHFMVMNALHQLKQRLWDDDQLRLDISPLHIQLISSTQYSGTQISEHTDEKLNNYYLDWSNLENTSANDVEKLLNKFWGLYISADKRAEALAVLNLEEDAGSKTISNRYRELAAIHHPDKGGDQATFISIRQAYETLK